MIGKILASWVSSNILLSLFERQNYDYDYDWKLFCEIANTR